MESKSVTSELSFLYCLQKMIFFLSRIIHFAINYSPLLRHSLPSSFITLHDLTPRCLCRRLGFAFHLLLDSDSWNSDELESQQDFMPVVNCVSYPPLGVNSSNKMYSFGRKWCDKEKLAKRIALALSKQGWDLNFLASFGIDLDSCYFARMLNDLFDESLDAALAFYLFRVWHRSDDQSGHELQILCTMVHIAVVGNMNHIAVNLLHEVVRSNNLFKDGLNLIFNTLWQTRKNAVELETSYSMLAICFAEQGMLKIATELIAKMEKFGFCPSVGACSTISFLLKPQFKGKFEFDGDLFAEMQSWGPRLIGQTLSLIIQELCACGCLESACKLLYDIPIFGGMVDNVSYTIVIDALCKRGLLKEATSLLFKMAQMGLPSDPTVIASLVHGYCKIGRLEVATTLLNFSSCILDSFIYNSFIFTLCQNGDVESAQMLLNMMFEYDVAPDSINYTTVIKGYCELYQIGHALKTFAQTLKRGIEPTIVTYTVLIEGHFKIDDIWGAEFVFSALERDGLQADGATYNVLINGYSKKGHMHKAYELVDLMRKAGVSPDSETYNIIMHGLTKRGFSVKTIFSELVRRGYFLDDVFSFDKFACTNIIHGYSNEGRLEEAYLIWCSMSKRGMTPDIVTCSALLNGFCKMHRMEDADVLFNKLLDAGLQPDLILYNTLLHGFCTIGDISKAHKLLIMMKANSIFPNVITHHALVFVLEKIGVENAQESATKLLQQIFLMD